MRHKLSVGIILAVLPLSLLGGCQQTAVSSSPADSLPPNVSSNDPVTSVARSCDFVTTPVTPAPLSYGEPTSFNPSLFVEKSYQRKWEKTLGDGVELYTASFQLTNGHPVKAYVVEGNLAKCSIEAGTSNDKAEIAPLASTYAHLEAFEKKKNKKVYAISNADFFGFGAPVNAFIKDDIIAKDSHNDNGYYDYTIYDADLPASMPMLFGVGSSQAKIGPIVENKSVKETVQSAFSYSAFGFRKNGEKVRFDKAEVNAFNPTSVTAPDFVFSSSRNVAVEQGDIIYGIKMHNDAETKHGEIITKEVADSSKSFAATAEVKYAIFPREAGDPAFEVGDVLGYAITSPDDTWLGYQTILGARHEILRNGSIVATVKLENSNGTANQGIPRTAVGIKQDGTVCLFSIEGLRYGSHSSSNSDTYGLSLSELAELMRYYGLVNACNFDGGGSTELIINDGVAGNGENKILTRSSDYGTYNLSDGRAVANTIVFTSKS